MSRRRRAVSETLDRIRGLRDTLGPCDELIGAIRPELVELGRQDDLFPEETFRVVEGTMTIYELSADLDGRLGLYASAGLPGKTQPPHDHRTWSCIAGVRGAEWNRYFDRVDDGADPTRGELEPTGETIIRSGDARGMMGHRFHAIEVIEDQPALHLHLYGDTLDRLAGRLYFESDDGGEVRHFMTRPDLHTALVTPAELEEMLADGEEIAVVDVRELGEWVHGHLLRASPLPRSRLELDARGVLPRPEVRIVVIGRDDARAREAAHCLRRGGYPNIAVLEGGMEACRAAEMAIHRGMGTFEKAFGELVVTELGTAKLSIAELDAMRADGAEHVLVDCRPRSEFENLRVPGARNAPGMSLLAGVEALELDPSTPVVVSCAGRTRSIIGAQTLEDAGLPNPVMSLENGAMGWRLTGRDLDDGPEPEPRLLTDPAARARAASRARELATADAIPLIDERTLVELRTDPTRSTYLIDVRLPEAYATGHRRGFRSVPGGQLLQELTQYVAVHGSRIVLVDEDGSEAVLTAHWLRRMGFEPYVLTAGLVGQHLVTDPEPEWLAVPDVDAVSWPAVEPERAAGALLIDCGSSRSYRRGHIEGALHCVRADLSAGLEKVKAERLLFTSEDGDLARLAAADAVAMGRAAVQLLGGNSAWVEAGHALVTDPAEYLVDPVDIWAKPYETSTDDPQSMQGYLDWEVALLETVDLTGLASLSGR